MVNRAVVRLLAGVYLPACLVLAVVLLAARLAGKPPELAMGDPAMLMEAPFYLGAVSHLGVLLWCGAASASLFTVALLWRRVEPSVWAFPAATALLAAVLLADDLWMLHESVVPGLLGVSQRATYAAYGAAVLGYLVIFREPIRRTRILPLVVAGALLAGSIGLDNAHDLHLVPSGVAAFLEDGLKFVGIASFAAWVIAADLELVRRVIDGAGEDELAVGEARRAG